MVGDVERKEVVALKRVGCACVLSLRVKSVSIVSLFSFSFFRGSKTVQLSFFTPEREGRVIYTLYVMSDSYLGLDQQYDVSLDVTPPSLETQVRKCGYFYSEISSQCYKTLYY